MILSGIFSSVVAGQIMPTYTPEGMQSLYNLTPAVVLLTTLSIFGMEHRLTPQEQAEIRATQPTTSASPMSTLRVTGELMRTNAHVRGFFWFVLLSVLGIFLQDAILEPFGAEVFNMTQKQTAAFQQSWGGGALLGISLMGIISSYTPLSKKTIAITGGLMTAVGLLLVAGAALSHQPGLMTPALLIMGLGVGFFDVGALSMMMDMTVESRLTRPDGLASDGELLRAYIRREVKLVDVAFISLLISGVALAQFYIGWSSWVFLKLGLFIAQFAATLGIIYLRIRAITYPCTPALYRRWYQLFGR